MPIHGKQHPDCQRKPINYGRDINVQQEREKKRQAVVFVSSFHPRGGVFCCSWRDGAGFFFFRGGTGRGSEAGRGGCFFFPRRDGAVVVFFRGGTGWLFFFFSTGRDGAVFCFFFRGPGRDGCFWRWQFFGRDGAKSLHRPAKGGLNRPASRPCKALVFSLGKIPVSLYIFNFYSILHYAGRVARMHDDRLPNIVMRGEMVGGKRKRGQPAKRLEHRVTEYCTAFGIDPKCWMRAAQDAPEWYRKVETGAEVFMSAWSTKRVNETNARHAKELFATLPFELP